MKRLFRYYIVVAIEGDSTSRSKHFLKPDDKTAKTFFFRILRRNRKRRDLPDILSAKLFAVKGNRLICDGRDFLNKLDEGRVVRITGFR